MYFNTFTMEIILSIRKFIQNNGALSWQYLFLLIVISISSAIFSFYYQFVYNSFVSIFILLISAFLQMLITYFFTAEKGNAYKVFSSLLFVLITFFLSKYLLFEHKYDFFLEAYIDRSEISWHHIAFYFSVLNFDSIILFVQQFGNFFSVLDYIIMFIMMGICLLQLFLPYKMPSTADSVEGQIKRVRFKKRKFD